MALPSESSRLSTQLVVLRILQGLGIVAALVVAWGMITTDGFFAVDNAKAIAASSAFVGIAAIGMTLIMISGAFVSLSIGTTAAVTATFFVYCLQFNIVIAIIAALLLGLAIGAVQGVAIGGWGANPIILTIAAGSIQSGITVALTGGTTVAPANTSYQFLNSTPLGLPVAVYVLVVLAVLAELMMRKTTFGKQIYMVGESRAAARAAGLPLAKIGAGVFALACGLTAVVGVFLGAYNQGASLLLDKTLTFDAIAATLVGGTAVVGGRGAIWRTVLGAVTIALFTDLLLLRGYSTGVQIMVKGLLVVLVVIAVHLQNRERAPR